MMIRIWTILRMRNQFVSVFVTTAGITIWLFINIGPEHTLLNLPKIISKQPNDVTQSKYATNNSKGRWSNVSYGKKMEKILANNVSGDDSDSIYRYICPPVGPNDTCRPLNYSERLLPVTALYSYPGSGNTWTRHLIQQITGIYTGSVYHDQNLKQNGFPGEGRRDGQLIVIKTHRADELLKGRYKRAIILIRNPFDALLAEFKRRNGGHVSNITEKVFMQQNMSLHFRRFLRMNSVDSKINRWLNETVSILKAHMPSLIVHYENLKTNLKQELIRIGDFLGFTIPADVLQCTVCNAEGSHHRKTKGFNPYSEQDKFKISSNIKALNETLKGSCGDSCTLPYPIPSLTDF